MENPKLCLMKSSYFRSVTVHFPAIWPPANAINHYPGMAHTDYGHILYQGQICNNFNIKQTHDNVKVDRPGRPAFLKFNPNSYPFNSIVGIKFVNILDGQLYQYRYLIGIDKDGDERNGDVGFLLLAESHVTKRVKKD